MSKKYQLFLLLTVIFDIAFLLTFYSFSKKDYEDFNNKIKESVALISLPDCALVTEARFIRHRTLSDTYSVFDFSPEASEIFPMSFVYNPSKTYNSEQIIVK